MLASGAIEIISLKRVVLFLIVLTFNAHAGDTHWYRIDGDYVFPDISENDLEDLIWIKALESDTDIEHPRTSYSYQYYMKDADTLYIFGFCSLNSFFNQADLTNRAISVFDGGSCYFSAWYSTNKEELVIQFNGVA